MKIRRQNQWREITFNTNLLRSISKISLPQFALICMLTDIKLIHITIRTNLVDGFQLDLCYDRNWVSKSMTRKYFSHKSKSIDFENFTVSTCANLRVDQIQPNTPHHINKSGPWFPIRSLLRRKFNTQINKSISRFQWLNLRESTRWSNPNQHTSAYKQIWSTVSN